MLDQVDDYARRPMRYQNIDGIWEMGIGFQWLGMMLLLQLWEGRWRSLPGNSVWLWRGGFVLSNVVLLLVVVYGQKALKKRITYPRTGFVKYRSSRAKSWIAGVIGGVVGVSAAIFLLRHFTFSGTVAVGSAMWGLFYAFATRLDEAYRWVVLVVMVAGPVAISTLPLHRQWLDMLPMEFLGLTLFVSGGITLCLYLRRTRPPEQEAE